MNKRKMLRDAIADAKTIKETALSNAKASLEESFTPHLKSMLATKIAEMDEDEDVDEELNTETTEDLALEENEISIENLMAELSEEDDVTEDVDVDEAKGDDDEKSKPKAKKVDSTDSKDDDADDSEQSDDAGTEGDEEIDLEDLSEEDLKGFIEGVIADMVDSGELEAGEGAEDGLENSDVDDLGAGDGLDAIGDDDLGVNVGEEVGEPTMEKQLQTTLAENKKLKRIIRGFKTLKEENRKINLFNSKLLYSNKIFRSKNLLESQKVKVLKAFDKATTTKESKIIYESLNTGIVETKPTTRRNMNFASKTTQKPRRKPLQESKIIDSDPMVKYFRKMAFGDRED